MDAASRQTLAETETALLNKIESFWNRSTDSDLDTDTGPSAVDVENAPKVSPTKPEVWANVRPAAVRNICQFLTTLSHKCKDDLFKMGLRHQDQASRKSTRASTRASRASTHHNLAANTMINMSTTTHAKRRHNNKDPWERRLQRLKVYQRAFSAIVLHFKAYSPVLFYIKKTYEDMLSYRINQFKMAHFEKKRLHIQKRNIKNQIQDYRFPEHYRLFRSKKYLSILRQKIMLQEEAIKVITGILNMLEESLSDHFERHRDLEEQIIMVDTEITKRRQKAFVIREKEEQKEVQEKDGQKDTTDTTTMDLLDSDEEDKDDPFYDVEDVDEERKMVWIMAFAICHKDLEEAEKKLAQYQNKYQYVVPRQEQEAMKGSIKEEREAAKALADEKSTLEEELKTLAEEEEKLNAELTVIKDQVEVKKSRSSDLND